MTQSLVRYSTVWVNPPAVFRHFPKRLITFNKFFYTHIYYAFRSMLDYKFLFNYLQLWRWYAILSEKDFFYTFHWNLTSKCAYWANDVTVDAMSYPARLFFVDIIKAADLGWLAKLPHTTINKAINDFRKRLNACVSEDGGHFEHIVWTR